MSDQIRAVDCPSCGAPLEIPPDQKRLFKCNFCGTTLEDLSTPREQKTGKHPRVVIHTSTTSTSRTYRTSKSADASNSSRTGWLVLALIVGIVGVAIIVPLMLTGVITIGGVSMLDEIVSLRIYSFGPTQQVPTDDDTHPDVVAVVSSSDDTDRMIYVDFDADSQLRWHSEPLGEGAIYIYNQIVASDSSIFMAYETTLVAFDRADGAILWELEISDQVSNICQDCLQVFDHWIVTLTADGMLTGHNVDTGEPTWNVRLNETTRQLLNLGGNIAVLDKEDDLVGINLYLPENGNRIQRIVPECPNEIFPDSPQTLGVYDPVLLSNNGENLYIPISNYDPGCLQKWDAATMTMYWKASIPRDVLDNFGWEPYLLSDDALFLSDGHNLYAISLLDGSYQTIYQDEDNNMTPIDEQDGFLLALAERTRGTSKYSLFGFDIATQSKLWEFHPAAEDITDNGSFVVHDTGAWGVNLGTGKPIILEAFTDPGVITFSVLNSKDSSITDQNSLEVNQNDYTYWMQIVDWQAEQLTLVVDARIWWINALTGEELATWPKK